MRKRARGVEQGSEILEPHLVRRDEADLLVNRATGTTIARVNRQVCWLRRTLR